VITIQGSGFNYVTPAYNAVNLVPISGSLSPIACTVILVHESQFTCSLLFPNTVQPNDQYEMSIIIRFSDTFSPVSSGVVGTLTVKAPASDSSEKGFISGHSANDSPTPSSNDDNHILIAVIVALGVLLVGAIGVVAYLKRQTKQVYRTGTDAGGRDDDYLPMSAAIQ